MSEKAPHLSVVLCFLLLSAGFFVPVAGNTASVSRSASDDWPMFRLNHLHTGYKEGKAPDTNDIDWIFDTGNNNRWIVSSAMIVDDFVYIGSDNGKLYKLKLQDGSEVWNYTVSSGTGCAAQFWSSPCVDLENNMVLCHATGVHAVDLYTGEPIWHFDTNTREFSSPVVHDGVVFVGSYDKCVYAIPQEDPNGDGTISEDELEWVYYAGEYQNGAHVEETGGAVSTTLAIVDGMVFGAEQTQYDSGSAYCDYNAFCLPQEDPDGSGVIEHDEIIWKYEIGEHLPVVDTGIPGEGGDCFSSPSVNVELGQVYIGSRDMNMYCLAIEPQGDGLDNDGDGLWDNEGELIWRTPVDNEVYSSPSYHDGKLFFGTGQYSHSEPGSVYCLRESDGSEVWSFQNDVGFLSSPLIADGKLFIGSIGDCVFVFNEDDGADVWSYEGPHAFGSSPTLYKGRIVIGCCNGMVYCFYPQIPNIPPEIALFGPASNTELPLPVVLEWEGSDLDENDADNLSYDLYLDTDKNATLRLASGLLDTSYELTELEDGTVYYWRVVASDTKDWTSSEIKTFLVNNSIPQNTAPWVTLLTPEDGLTLEETEIELEWEGEDEDGDDLLYTVYLDDNSYPGTMIGENLSGESLEVQGLKDGVEYYWRVMVNDGSDEAGSAIWSFVIELPQPNQKPSITMDDPKEGELIEGIYTIKGNAEDDKQIAAVDLRIDDGNWILVSYAANTQEWNYNWDTSKFEAGTHSITVRAFDGELYSEELTVSVSIATEEEPAESGDDESDDFEIAGVNGYAVLGGSSLTLVMVLAAVFLFLRREEEDDDYYDEDEEEDYDYY